MLYFQTDTLHIRAKNARALHHEATHFDNRFITNASNIRSVPLTAIPYLNKVDVNFLLCRDYYAARPCAGFTKMRCSPVLKRKIN